MQRPWALSGRHVIWTNISILECRGHLVGTCARRPQGAPGSPQRTASRRARAVGAWYRAASLGHPGCRQLLTWGDNLAWLDECTSRLAAVSSSLGLWFDGRAPWRLRCRLELCATTQRSLWPGEREAQTPSHSRHVLRVAGSGARMSTLQPHRLAALASPAPQTGWTDGTGAVRYNVHAT